jgi:hypothetical protein
MLSAKCEKKKTIHSSRHKRDVNVKMGKSGGREGEFGIRGLREGEQWEIQNCKCKMFSLHSIVKCLLVLQ